MTPHCTDKMLSSIKNIWYDNKWIKILMAKLSYMPRNIWETIYRSQIMNIDNLFLKFQTIIKQQWQYAFEIQFRFDGYLMVTEFLWKTIKNFSLHSIKNHEQAIMTLIIEKKFTYICLIQNYGYRCFFSFVESNILCWKFLLPQTYVLVKLKYLHES